MANLGSMQSLHSGQCLMHPRAMVRAGASRAQLRVMADVGEERPMPRTQDRPKVLSRRIHACCSIGWADAQLTVSLMWCYGLPSQYTMGTDCAGCRPGGHADQL